MELKEKRMIDRGLDASVAAACERVMEEGRKRGVADFERVGFFIQSVPDLFWIYWRSAA